jgi:hypothetical protein
MSILLTVLVCGALLAVSAAFSVDDDLPTGVRLVLQGATLFVAMLVMNRAFSRRERGRRSEEDDRT